MHTVLYKLTTRLYRARVVLITAFCGLLFLAAPHPEASAQVRTDSVRVYFRVNKSNFDPAFKQNGKVISDFIQRFRESQTNPDAQVVVESVLITSSASPEGPFSLNEELARNRQQAILDYLEGKITIAQEGAVRSTDAIDWDMLRTLVLADSKMPQAYRDQILSKLDSGDRTSVNTLRGTPAGKYLWDQIYPKMRTTSLVIVWEAWKGLEFPELCYDEAEVEPVVVDENLFAPLDASYSAPALMEHLSRRGVLLKINALALPALIANLGVEVQPLPHFSISVPIYYSGWNWFSETIKFRTLATQPELRYWFDKDCQGLFLNAHATFGWYNVAWNGDYRYQDYAQKTPALGGGIGIGYKLPLGGKSSRWGLECGLGAGVLPLHYDIYYNVQNGRLAGEDQKTYWGIDQAFVSVTYRIASFKSKQK